MPLSPAATEKRMPAPSLPLLNLVKVVAAQLILWHHFALYGPMSDVVNPLLSPVSDWLLEYGPLAVQAFLAIGGFLVARSFLEKSSAFGMPELPRRLLQRYRRLIPLLASALLLAVVSAALARALIVHPTIPGPPTTLQVFAHLFLLQDIVGEDALSAGVWYVAIDFQLFALFALVQSLSGRYAIVVCAMLTTLSLFWLNRNPALDVWAPYFFGTYGLGVLACWVSGQARRSVWGALLGVLVIAALAIEWRSRIAVGGAMALILAATGGQLKIEMTARRVIEALAEQSYALFLVHYPVLLAVGAVVHRLWPFDTFANVGGLVTAWVCSLLLAWGLFQAVETRRAR